MTSLDSIIAGKDFDPPRVMIHGGAKVGKSTTAAGAPNVIFTDIENGLGAIGAPRFPVAKTYGDVIDNIRSLMREKHDYQSYAIDSLDWLETLIWADVCSDHGVDSISDFGYGKGYKYALDLWHKIKQGL